MQYKEMNYKEKQAFEKTLTTSQWAYLVDVVLAGH